MSQLQILGSTLISGDAGGVVRVWSLEDFTELRKIRAQENSVTSMQCDGSKIVSGGSDGAIKVWNLESGELERELVSSDAVWKVGFVEGRIVGVFSQNKEVVVGVSFPIRILDVLTKSSYGY